MNCYRDGGCGMYGMKIEEVKEVKMEQQYADNIKEDLELMVNAVNGAYGMVTFLRITESANVLREALEKQTPKKAVTQGMTNEGYWVVTCPECETVMEGMRYIANYCCKCGQRIVWGD